MLKCYKCHCDNAFGLDVTASGSWCYGLGFALVSSALVSAALPLLDALEPLSYATIYFVTVILFIHDHWLVLQRFATHRLVVCSKSNNRQFVLGKFDHVQFDVQRYKPSPLHFQYTASFRYRGRGATSIDKAERVSHGRIDPTLHQKLAMYRCKIDAGLARSTAE